MSGSLRRQVGEGDRRRDQRVERGVVQQVERGGKTAAIVPARAVRRRDLADLAGDELQAAGVEDVAERHFHVVGAVPGQFQHRRLVAGEPQRGREPGRRRAGVHHQVAVAGRLRRAPRSRRRTPARSRRAPGLMSTTVTSRAGYLGAQPRDQQPEHAGADHRDPVRRTGRAVPDGVERRLHVGGEHGALGAAARRAAARYFRPEG